MKFEMLVCALASHSHIGRQGSLRGDIIRAPQRNEALGTQYASGGAVSNSTSFSDRPAVYHSTAQIQR